MTPCAEEDILIISPPEGLPVDVDYYLTDVDTYQMPPFTVNYVVCDLLYSIAVTPSTGQDGIVFDNDAAVRELTYNFELDGAYLGTYEIKITALVAEAMAVNLPVTWELNVLYPCSDTNFITISGEPPEQ